MSFSNLLTWIGLDRLEESAAPEVPGLVEAALDEMSEEDPRCDALSDIEDELLEGRVPVELLRQLARDFPQAPVEELSEADRMEREYRTIAAAYREEQWRSQFYVVLERHLDDSDDETLLDFAAELRERITASYRRYCDDFERVQGTSPEIEVGHRFMKEGYQRWMEALDLVEAEGDVDEILQLAEEAVRLLAAVGQLDREVRQQASTMDSAFRPGR